MSAGIRYLQAYTNSAREMKRSDVILERGPGAAEGMRSISSYGAEEHYLFYNLQGKQQTEHNPQHSLQCVTPQVLLGIEEAL